MFQTDSKKLAEFFLKKKNQKNPGCDPICIYIIFYIISNNVFISFFKHNLLSQPTPGQMAHNIINDHKIT